jgi:hypothetical protein
VSQIHGVTPRIKIHNSDPSMYASIRIVRQLKQVFNPYRIMFKEFKEKEKAASIIVFLQRKGKH